MRLHEIEPDAAERRLSVLRANVKAAKAKANELKARADTSAAQVDMQGARQQLTKQQRSPAMTMIKPYH